MKGWNYIRKYITKKMDSEDYDEDKVAEHVGFFMVRRLSQQGLEDTERIMGKKYPTLLEKIQGDIDERKKFFEGKPLPEGTIRSYSFEYAHHVISYRHEDAGYDKEEREWFKKEYNGGASWGGRFYEIDVQSRPGWVGFLCKDSQNIWYEKSRMKHVIIKKEGE